MRGLNLFALKACVKDMERQSNQTAEEPRRYMLFVKQHLVPPEVMKPSTPVFNRLNNTEQSKVKSQSLVEHQYTDDNQACVKFNIIVDQAGSPNRVRRQIQVCQNQVTCAIEIRYLLPYGAMVHNLITANRPSLHYKKTIELILSGPLVHLVEFDSNFKLN